MNKISRIITGSIMVVGGFGLLSFPFFIGEKMGFISWFYGLPIFILGIFILFNDKEDRIDGRKDKKWLN